MQTFAWKKQPLLLIIKFIVRGATKKKVKVIKLGDSYSVFITRKYMGNSANTRSEAIYE